MNIYSVKLCYNPITDNDGYKNCGCSRCVNIINRLTMYEYTITKAGIAFVGIN